MAQARRRADLRELVPVGDSRPATPILYIAQVRYRPTSETVSRRGVAGLLWLLSRGVYPSPGGQGRDTGPGGEGTAFPTPDVSGASLFRGCVLGWGLVGFPGFLAPPLVIRYLFGRRI